MYAFKQFLVIIYYSDLKNPLHAVETPTLWDCNDPYGISDILTYVVAYVVKASEHQSSPEEKEGGDAGKNVHLQAHKAWTPPPTLVFVVLADISLSLCQLFKIFKSLFCPSCLLWPFCEGAFQRSANSPPAIHGIGTSLLLSPFSLSHLSISFMCSPLWCPVFPCLSFQRAECVAASQLTAFPLEYKKEGKGCREGV